jgi:hypothetical protein
LNDARSGGIGGAIMQRLKDRVGRFAATGRHCQNWKQDQEIVISLLNKIPIAKGGSEGTLNTKVMTGHASDGLYSSILYFQKNNFPGEADGNIRPGGPTFRKLVELSAHSVVKPVPKPEGQWAYIATGSVESALRKGLGDGSLSHAETVDIVKATLADGRITQAEINDLREVAATAKSLSTNSKSLLNTFVDGLVKRFKDGSYHLTTDRQKYAAEIICEFLKRNGTSHFPKLRRETVGVELLMRVANPGLLRQSDASLCGPAAVLFNFASDWPGQYAKFAIELFEKGKAQLGRLEIKPGTDVRNYLPAPLSKDATDWIDQADWLTMASIRDSENWFFDYDTAEKEFAGITAPGELAHWFYKAGYRDVKNDTNLTNMTHKDVETVDGANGLFKRGYRVCLFISANMTEQHDMSKPENWSKDDQSVRGSIATRHWVVQRSLIDRSSGKIKLKIFTWGDGDYSIPNGSRDLPVDQFLGNFYGYVAGKP